MLAATDARELIRERVLCLTSELRNGVDVLLADPADPSALETMQRASRSFNELAKQHGLRSLVESGSLLERLPAVADALRWAQPDEMPVFLAGANDVLGTVEELLDWCLEEADASRQSRLIAGMGRFFSDRWRRLLEADSDVFARQLKTLTRPPATATPRAIPSSSPHPAAAAAARPGQTPPRSTAPKAPICSIPTELLETFEAEALERLQRCEELLLQLEQDPEQLDHVHALLRELHTLKGAAAEVGLDSARAQVHEGESLLAAIRDGIASVAPSLLVDFFLRLLDSVRGILDQTAGRASSAFTVIEDVAGEMAQLLAPAQASQAGLDGAGSGDNVAPLAELTQLRERLGAAADDPEVVRLIEALDRQTRQYSEMAVGLKEELDRLRLMPLDDIFRRLLRPVRDASRQEGKRAQLKALGGDLRVDRDVGERLHSCLLHLVRNAVSHGIELPEVREAAGKPSIGTIRITARMSGEHLELSTHDDGGGLDYEAIFAQAEKNGWIDPTQPPTRDELASFIFRPGFSTRSGVDDLAGRGVGMDVVARDIEELKGQIAIESREGQGTCFRLTLPLQSVNRASA